MECNKVLIYNMEIKKVPYQEVDKEFKEIKPDNGYSIEKALFKVVKIRS